MQVLRFPCNPVWLLRSYATSPVNPFGQCTRADFLLHVHATASISFDQVDTSVLCQPSFQCRHVIGPLEQCNPIPPYLGMNANRLGIACRLFNDANLRHVSLKDLTLPTAGLQGGRDPGSGEHEVD
jgi:hypothetical protein